MIFSNEIKVNNTELDLKESTNIKHPIEEKNFIEVNLLPVEVDINEVREKAKTKMYKDTYIRYVAENKEISDYFQTHVE